MEGHEPSYRDALLQGPAHRRGAGLNPGNRFEDARLHARGRHRLAVLLSGRHGEVEFQEL